MLLSLASGSTAGPAGTKARPPPGLRADGGLGFLSLECPVPLRRAHAYAYYAYYQYQRQERGTAEK